MNTLKDCIISLGDVNITSCADTSQGEGILTDYTGEYRIIKPFSWFYPYIYLHGAIEDLVEYDQCIIYGKDLISYMKQLIRNKSMIYSVSQLELYHDGVYRDVTLYLWRVKPSKFHSDINNDDTDVESDVVKGLIVDSTIFADNEYARQKMVKRPLII